MKDTPEKEKKQDIDITDSIKVGNDYKLDKDKAGIKDDFDIVDFALKHNKTYSVKKRGIVPKIIISVVVVLLIVTVCVLGAVLSGAKEEATPEGGSIIGVWVSGDVTMYIDEQYITIGSEKNEYVITEDNVIALKINQGDYYDYYKMLYSVDKDKLTIVILTGDTGKKIEYTRK